MSKSKKWIATFMILLSMSALACNALSGGEEPSAAEATATAPAPTESEGEENEGIEPTATPLPLPTDATEPADEATSTPVPLPTETESSESSESLSFSPSESGLSELSSYEMSIRMTFDGETDAGVPVVAGVNGIIAYSADPPAQGLDITVTGDTELGDQQIAFAQMDGMVYMSLGELGCVSGEESTMSDAGSIADSMSPEELLEELENADFIGEETHGGVDSDCYAFDQSNLLDPDQDFDTLDGKICVAQQGDFLTYLHVEGEGSNSDFTGDGTEAYGHTVIDIAVNNVNQPIQVQIPQVCLDAPGSSYPMMEDATGVTQFQGFVTYTTETPIEDIIDFYQAEMPAAGYTAAGEPNIMGETLATLEYTMEGETVNITITQATDVTGFQVLITSQDGE